MRKHRHLPLVAIFCLLVSGSWVTDAQEAVKMSGAADIIFLVDSSWSIGKEHFQLVREFLYDVIQSLAVGGSDFRFALVQFNGNPHTEFLLNTYRTNQEVLSHISNMTYLGGDSKTGRGLQYVIQNHLTQAAGSRASDGVPQVIIVLTDGRSQDDVAGPSAELKSASAVDVFAIGVQDAEEGELKQMASEPLDLHVFNLENFTALHDIVGNLVACVRSSMVADIAGATEIPKDITAQESADLIFLIDGSDKTGSAHFAAIRDFLVNFLERLSIGARQIQVGVVQYSNEPRTAFSLNSYSTKADILDAVKALRVIGGEETNLGAALDFVVENHFTQAGGSRVEEGVPQVLVLISGSQSSDDIRDGVVALKQASIFSFGLGAPGADRAELQNIATDENFVFTTPDFRSLGDLREYLLPYIVGVAQRTIVLQPPTIVTQVIEVNKRDIVFLVDGTSTRGSANFNAIRDFIYKVIQKLEIGQDLIQVAVAQYTHTVKPEFYFKDFHTRRDVLSAVRRLKPLNGTALYTGAALNHIRNNFFNSSVGHRAAEGVPKLLVLITGGKSLDDISLPAQELKRSGIMAFSIGSPMADRTELEEVAFDSSLVFIPPEFRPGPLQAILPGLLAPLRTLSGITQVPVNKRDIIFLLDGSFNVGNTNFPYVRDFVMNLVNSLDVGYDSIRVGLVQFSDTPETEFSLNTYQSKADLLARLRQLQLKGGSTLNIGSALDFVRSNHFTEAGGSRIHENVPQLLLLLAAGQSGDSYLQASNALARAGVLTFCVGASQANKAELEQIAFNPSLVYLMDDFNSLPALPQQLIQPLTTYVSGGVEEVPLAPTENKRDILFLLDGSANLVGQFPAVRDFLYKIIDELDVKPDGTRIAVAQYSDNVRIESRFSEHQNKGEILNVVKRMKIKTGKPLNMGYALDLAQRDIFVKSAGSRIEEGVPQVLVLLAAGRSTDRVDVPAQNLRQVGIIPFIFQAKNADAAELERIVPSPAFILTVESLPKIGELQPQIVNLLKTVQNGEPSQGPGERKDVVFLIDGSEGVRSGFSLLKEFVQRVVESLDVGPDRVRVAVVQYSERARPEFYLNSYSDQQAVVNAIRRLTLLGGSSLNTGSALDFVMRNMLVESAGSRIAEGVPQFLIVLSASRSRDDIRGPSVVLKRSGAVPFGIRIGLDDDTEMRTISYIPDFAVVIPTFQQLGSVQQVISEKVTLLTREELDKITPVLTYVTPGVSSKRDVVFLIDGSQNMVQEFSYVRGLIERLVEDLDVGFDTTRVAVIQFSEDPRVEFLLNAYTSKDEVQNAVRRLRPKGGRQINVGSALDYVSKNIFRRPLGSRIEEGVPQFLVLVSSGRSDDEVEDSAVQIKQAGVAPFTVARNADPEELVKISLSPEYVFSVSTFRELPSLEQKLLTPITTLTSEQIQNLLTRTQYPPPAVEHDAADIIFLIDSSDSVRQDGLAHIRDFIGSIVRKLNIGPNRVRIGVLQFSNDVFPEFYLKTYKSQAAVLDAIRRLRLRGGSPLNTGKALDFVAKNFFVKSAGSRIEDGVPQHLVLFLGGKSQDDVSRSSRVIGSAGIVSVGVGSRNVDRAELQTITNNDRFIFTVRDFRDLRNIESQVINSFGPSGVTPTPPGPFPPSTPVAKKADIVFLLDGSINFRRDDFQEVLRFASGIVDTIYEGGDSIQVGLVQYNTDPTDEFFLKDFSTKEEIIDAINKVVYKGGREANTFVGLDHLRKNHFVPEAGSRIDQRIPQIAFVITGGASVEDTEEATRALSQKGVKVFAVGVKNIDLREVSKIASNSAIAFRVSNVQELSELSEQVLETLHDAMHETLCPGMTDVSRACNLDVILGFDGSRDQNVFVSQRGLESKVDAVLNRITQLQRISCTGSQEPTVRVAAVAYTPSGPVEGFDFSEYQPDLFEKFQTMRNQHPYLLTADTLKVYQNKFRSSPAGSVKVVIHFTDGVDGSLAELEKASAELQEEGVKALIFVGLERVANYDNVMQLEFGRGFTYNRPLTVNLMDLDYELAEQLDSIAERACCGVPCKCSGQRGDRGPLGSVGPKGMPGEDGYRGYPGDEGGPGERGPPGVNGTQGFQGCPGQRGTKGSRGFPGEKGELGEIGLDGLNGEEGDNGLPGSSGERGSAGRRGDRGVKGEKGERGDMGIRGDPGEIGLDSQQRGPKGEKGEIGPMGMPGFDGSPGGPGVIGKDGGPGRRGPPGVKGNKGNPGQVGISGEPGARGPQGPSGPTGPPGLIGEQGISGPRGGGGTPGVPGDRGRPGPLGAKGEPGELGPKGGNGPRGPRGEMGDDGRDGIGLEGQKGKKGERGFPGYPGPKGAPGDRGVDGGPGSKGSRGRRGNSGPPGSLGQKGDPGYPGPSGHKGNRGESVDQCALIQSIKDKCPCCYGPLECPVFPTELAFALDTSQGVNQDTFSRMRDTLLRIVNDMTIAESNCPRGARVAVVTYNNEVTTEIRFPDSKRKSILLDRIRNLQVPLTSKERSLETAMSFVARNTFKRARSGFLMRKVAVFFSNGPVRASPQLNEAVLKLSDAGITPLFLTSREDRALINALQINNTAVGHALVLPATRNLDDFLKTVFTCHVCLDICNPDPSCGFDSVRPAFRDRRAAGSDVDIDMAFILDSSETTTPFAFNEMKKYITYMVKQLDISPDPKMSQHLTRVAVLQHAPWEHEMNTSIPPVHVEVSLTDYGSKDKLIDFLSNRMTLLPGTRALGNAIEYTIESIFESAPNPRDLKIVVLMVTGEVRKSELDDLQRIIVQAKCKGYFFVVLGIGRNVSVKDVYGFASEPNDVFFKLADKPTELNEEPLLRFARLLPSFVNSENAFYLSPDIRKQCDWFQGDQPAKNSIKFGQRQIHVPNNATTVSTPKPVTTTKLTTSAALPSEKQPPAKVAPASPAAANLPSVKQAPANPAPAKQVPANPAAAHLPSVKQAPANPAPAKQVPASPAAANLPSVKQAPVNPAPINPVAANPASVKQAPVNPAPAKQVPASPAAANLPSVKQASVNPAPVKQAPVNPVVANPAAVKQAPVNPVVANPAPVKQAPVNPVVANPVPVKQAPANPATVARPVASKPVAPKPVAAKSVATKPVTTKPLSTKPQATKPLSPKPAVKTSREVQVSDITENSAKLRWVNPDQPNPYIYDLTITSMHDRSVVLKQNLTVAERIVGGLVAGQTYHVAIISYLKSQVKATYEGTFTTKKVQSPPPQVPKTASSATLNLMVNSEPWKGMEADVCKRPKEIGTCRKFNLKWFYDPETKSCGRFWYSGCGSNGNNFETQSDCEKACLPAHINPGVISTIGT